MLFLVRVSSRSRDFLPPLRRFGRAGRIEAPVELGLDERRIFDQADDLSPHDLIEQVLADRSAVAHRAAEMAPGVRAGGSGNSGSCAQSCASTCATARSRICGTRPVLERCWARWSGGARSACCRPSAPPPEQKSLRDDGRNRYLDPLVTRPLVTAALFAMDRPPRQAEGPRHLLPLSHLRLVEAGRTFVRRVAQHRPHD